MKAVLVSLFASAAALSAEPSVTLAGIQVVFNDGGEAFDGFKTFNSGNGTRVAVIVRSDDKTIVGVNHDEAVLTVGGAEARCRFFGDSAFSEDRRAVRLEFETEGEVKASADGRVKIAGEIPVSFASGKEETRSERFKVEAGVEIKFPDDEKDLPALKVKSTGKPQFGDAALEVTFTTNRKLDEFAGIRFHTKNGEAVEANRRGSSWMGFGGKGSGQVEFWFDEPQAELVVVVESWTGVEKETVAVDFHAGLAGVE